MRFNSLQDELFYRALRIRMVEERIRTLYPDDKIQSPVHLSIGQEAVAVGVCHTLRPTDLVFGSYRSHAFYLAKHGDLRQMFAELYGKATGMCKGKAGSMHLTAPEVGFMGSSAVVASTIPHAVGAALAAKRLNRDQVIVAVFGDGATDEGVYHESLNFAALHQLPVLFICENNGLAIHSRPAARQAYRIPEHARAYHLPVAIIPEGYDFLRIHTAVSGLVDDMRRRHTPQFVEIHTYRYCEHVGPSEDYQAGYRSRAELEAWKRLDPLEQNPSLAASFREAIAREIDDAVAHAEASPWPGRDELLTDVI